jgi:hypothetical protein
MRPEGLGKLIKIIHFIGPRTRDLLVYNSASLYLGADTAGL